MIEVDEENFMIVTDIDRLMHLVATQRRVELSKLSRELKMNSKEVEKWLHILEDEGLIKIEHSLTKVYAVWAGAAAPRPPEKKREAPKERREAKPLPPPVVGEEAEERFQPFSQEELAPLEEEILEFRPEPEEPPAKERPPEKKSYSIVKRQKEKEKPKAKRREEEPAPRKTDFLEMEPVETESLKEKLDDYLKLIRESKKELKGLESEKERIYREGYLPLEKEFEASLENIQFSILEKEKRIMEAKEKVADLPEQVEELEKLQDTVKEVEEKARSILSRTRGQLDERADTLQEATEELGEQISHGEGEAMRERAKMFELKELLGSIQTNEESIRNAIEESRRQMDEAKGRVGQLEDDLADLVDARTLLAERIDTIQSGLERKVRTLEELKGDLGEIEKIEGWFREYSKDYTKKITDLEQYVAGNQEEVARLMEAAELEYVKKYLEELAKAEEEYRERLHGLEMQDTDLEQRISEAKSRIRELLAESTKLMETSRRKSASSFDTSAAKKRVEEKVAALEEKAKERKGLFESLKGRGKKKK